MIKKTFYKLVQLVERYPMLAFTDIAALLALIAYLIIK